MISNNMIIAGDRTSIGRAGSVIFYNSVLLNKVTFMWSSCGRASSRATGWPTRLSSGNFPPTCGPAGVGYFWKYLPHHQSAKWDNLYWISPGRTTWSGAVPSVARFVKYEQVDVGSCNGLQQVPGWSRDLPTTGRKESSNLLIPPSLTQETGLGQLQWWLCCYSASIACRDFIILKLWTELFEVRNRRRKNKELARRVIETFRHSFFSGIFAVKDNNSAAGRLARRKMNGWDIDEVVMGAGLGWAGTSGHSVL